MGMSHLFLKKQIICFSEAFGLLVFVFYSIFALNFIPFLTPVMSEGFFPLHSSLGEKTAV